MASQSRTGQVTRQDRIRSLLGQYGIGIVLVIMMIVIAIMEPRFMVTPYPIPQSTRKGASSYLIPKT